MKNTKTFKKNYEFKNILIRGKGYFGKYVSIYILNSNNNVNEIGIAVGKKLGVAVKRNRVKRWIRETYNYNEEKLKDIYKIVFVVKKDVKIEELDYKKIKDDIEELLKKAGAI